jgi:hypothetical protein
VSSRALSRTIRSKAGVRPLKCPLIAPGDPEEGEIVEAMQQSKEHPRMTEPDDRVFDAPRTDVSVRRHTLISAGSTSEHLTVEPGGVIAYSAVPGSTLTVIDGTVTLFTRDHDAQTCSAGFSRPVGSGYWCRNDSDARAVIRIDHASA